MVLESSLISERVKAGMAAAKARGKKLGRPRTPTYLIEQIQELAETTAWNHLICPQVLQFPMW